MAVYKVTEMVGTGDSYAHATEEAIKRAVKKLRNVSWFEVKEMRGAVTDGKIEFQVKLQIGFKLDD
ncbi:MAG TPA: dodecin family protein [Candidatus Xenobia bacterium]|jgi:hypothetical protein